MLFTSLDFCIFLPIVLLLYYCLTHRAQNVFLVIASYVFYGWWDWRFTGLMAFSTVLDYYCAIGIESGPRKFRRGFLVASLVGNLGVLAAFKYFNFFVASAESILQEMGFSANLPFLNIILPVGISFYTFQTMAYTIDVYRRELPATRDFILMSLYVSYFPQLVAGPIERATHLFPQFDKARRVDERKLHVGCFLIFLGLFKKLAIADSVAPIVEIAFQDTWHAQWPTLLKGIWLFSIQIYGDFSGYSDIARGVSLLLGIELMENFNQPYLSTSITEFWRRWHISLSAWLRDYLYISLGGNRHGSAKTYRNLIITMLLGGLWHGASWTFVAWGGLHGAYLAVHKVLLRGNREPPRFETSRALHRLMPFAKGICTFHLVMLTWIFFRASSFSSAIGYLNGLLTFRGMDSLRVIDLATIGFYACLVLLVDFPQYLLKDHCAILRWHWPICGFVLFVMSFLILLLCPDNETPFIYFQF